MAKKKLSDTERLAIQFVTEFLGRNFSYNTDRRFLKEAAFYLSPKADPITNEEQRKFTLEEVWGCLQWMKRIGVKRISSIHAVAWTHYESGKTYLEEYCKPEAPPPIYMKMEIKQWEERYGKTLQL